MRLKYNSRQPTTLVTTVLMAMSVFLTIVDCVKRRSDNEDSVLINNITDGNGQQSGVGGLKSQLLLRSTQPGKQLAESLVRSSRFVQNDDKQLANSRRKGGQWNVSETFWHRVKGQTNAINFRSPAAYLVTRFKLYSTFSIQFEMRSSSLVDGLILFTGSVGGSGKDFMAVELLNGRLRYVFDLGGGPRTVIAGSDPVTSLNDDSWHRVSIVRSTLSEHVITVDDYVTTDHLSEGRSLFFDTGDELYIGGVPEYAYNTLPKQIRSRDGYLGCIASVQLDRRSVNLLEHPIGIPKAHRKNIVSGCQGADRQHDEGKVTECSDRSCENGGVCLQQPDGLVCNCEMTSYTGPTCRDDSIAYKFGRHGGIVTFTFPEGDWPDTKRDHISLGFRTVQSDAVLLRITSASSNDFIEMELVDANLVVIYNVGLMQHPIGELFEKFDDGQYHVVRFTRDGPNSTIQVDNLPVQPKHPTEFYQRLSGSDESGQQLTTFNHQHKIIIGGRQETGNILRPFHGTISGLVVNGLRILDMASDRDDRVSIEGDVELEVKLTRPSNSPKLFEQQGVQMSHSTAGWYMTMRKKWSLDEEPKTTDDLVVPIKNQVSRCPPDQPDCPLSVHPSTDSFIRPLTKKFSLSPSTKWKRPETTSKTTTSLPSFLPRRIGNTDQYSGSPVPCDNDDEDCDAGSTADVNIRVTTRLSSPYHTAPSRQVWKMTEPEKTSSIATETVPPNRQWTQTSAKSSQHPIPLTTGSTSRAYLSNEFGRDDDDEEEEEEDDEEEEEEEVQAFPDENVEVEPDIRDIHEKGLFPGRSLSMNIGLIAGIGAGAIVLIIVLAYALYKFSSRSQGPRKMNQLSQLDYDDTGQSILPSKDTGNTVGGQAQEGAALGAKRKKKDVKEWYV